MKFMKCALSILVAAAYVPSAMAAMIPLGTGGAGGGGIGVYYNVGGPEDPSNQAYFRSQRDISTSDRGSYFQFDTVNDLGGGVTMNDLFSGQPAGFSQFGFDLSAGGNHDQIVYDALMEGTPFAALLDLEGSSVSEAQPLFGVTYGQRGENEVHVEVKTRSAPREHLPEPDPAGDPISVYLTVRRYGPFKELGELPEVLESLARAGEAFVESSLAPRFLAPLREAIASRGG